MVDTNLRDIVSPFLHSLAALNMSLTPQEIEVANMVRSGKSSKEIAEVLNLSVSGVDFHRKRLRSKLGSDPYLKKSSVISAFSGIG